VDAQPVQLKPSLFQYTTLAFQAITAVSVVYGLISIPIEIGRKDQILTQQQKSTEELHSVVQDLVKTTINLTGTDRVHDRDLNDMRSRLERLESKRG
jgi:cell division protein FtsL